MKENTQVKVKRYTTHCSFRCEICQQDIEHIRWNCDTFIDKLNQNIRHANLYILSHSRSGSRCKRGKVRSRALRMIVPHRSFISLSLLGNSKTPAHLIRSRKPLKRSTIISSALDRSQISTTDLTLLRLSKR